MARKKKETVKEVDTTEKVAQNIVYRVTAKNDDNIVTLKNRTIIFDENSQAIVTEEELDLLRKMGVIL